MLRTLRGEKVERALRAEGCAEQVDGTTGLKGARAVGDDGCPRGRGLSRGEKAVSCHRSPKEVAAGLGLGFLGVERLISTG